MEAHEIQAKAAIAAALIQTQGAYDMQVVYQYASDPQRSIQLGQLRTAVDMIYSVIVNPR